MLAELHVCVTTASSCTDSTALLDVLLPAGIGAVFGLGASLLLRRGEHSWQRKREEDQRRWQQEREADARRWQEDRDRFARDLQIARPLDAALVETQRRVQGQQVPDGQSRWSAAHEEWEAGWVALTPHLADAELEERYKAVGTILLEFQLADDQDAQTGTKVMVAMRAIANARISIAAYVRGDALPSASFPTSQKTIELLGQGDPDPLKADGPLRAWLADHETPEWRAPQPDEPGG